jgi:hypothetical protein
VQCQYGVKYHAGMNACQLEIQCLGIDGGKNQGTEQATEYLTKRRVMNFVEKFKVRCDAR